MPTLLSNMRGAQSVYERHEDAAANADLVLASYNIHKCVGADGRFDPHRIATVIDELDADVVALQEVDRRFGRRDGLLDLLHIEQQSGLIAVPVANRVNGHGWHGNAMLYREAAVRDLHRITLPGAEPRGAILVDLEIAGGSLRIIAAHLGLLRRSRAKQIDALLTEVSERGTKPTVIVGDLNEWRLGNRSALSGLHPTFGPVDTALPSFPARYPLLALDRVYATPTALIRRIEVHDSPTARTASDHRPIKAYIRLSAGDEDKKGTAREAAAA